MYAPLNPLTPSHTGVSQHGIPKEDPQNLPAIPPKLLISPRASKLENSYIRGRHTHEACIKLHWILDPNPYNPFPTLIKPTLIIDNKSGALKIPHELFTRGCTNFKRSQTIMN